MTEFPKKFLPLNGHTVMKATGPNGNHIYFPHTGTTKIIDVLPKSYCQSPRFRTASGWESGGRARGAWRKCNDSARRGR